VPDVTEAAGVTVVPYFLVVKVMRTHRHPPRRP